MKDSLNNSLILTNQEYRNKYLPVLKQECKSLLKDILFVILFFAIIFLVFNLIPNKQKFIMKYKISKAFCKESFDNDEYTYDDFICAVNNNDSFTPESKELIISLMEKEITENKEYINYKKMLDRFSSCKVSYFKNAKNVKNGYKVISEKANVAGNYNVFFNEMSFFENNDINSENVTYVEDSAKLTNINETVYFHELNHMQTNYTISSVLNKLASKNPVLNMTMLTEAFNEIFSQEYIREYLDENLDIENNKSYSDYMPIAYAFAEILPEEAIRKYKFNDNECILISALLEIDNNIDEVYNLISAINSIDYLKYQKQINPDSTQLDTEIANNYKKIYNGFSYFYEKKNNKSMDNDKTIATYFHETPMINEMAEDILNVEKCSIIPKGYFSEYCKKNYPDVQIRHGD